MAHGVLARLRLLVSAYDRALQTTPLRTKIMTSFTIFTGADVSRQLLVEQQTFDAARTSRMALFGISIHPLWLTGWFGFMEKWQGAMPTGASRAAIFGGAVKRMLIDQTTSSPAFVATFIGAMAVMQGVDVQQKIGLDWWTTVKGAWSFW